MDSDRVKGNWKQFKGKVQEKWGKLTDDEMEQAKGSSERLEGLIQEKYGETKDAIRKQLDKL